jgi:IS605 OrfB family transposase
MKLTLQTQLYPDQEQVRAMEATLRAFNAAATWAAVKAFEMKSANKIKLQKLHYAELRTRFGLSAQMAVRCLAQACEAYKRDRRICPEFREFAAMPFDQRMMSFKGLDHVSLLTLTGRILVPFIMGTYQAQKFSNTKGQCDLVRRKDGLWFLLVTVDVPDGSPLPTTDFIGVDLGVANLATDSDSAAHTGAGVEACRQRFGVLRGSLQQAAAVRLKSGARPKSIRRRLKKLGSKEARFRRDVNHKIAKELVLKAKDTKRGIALEDLNGIRERTRFPKSQRNKIHGWAFYQLRIFIQYKAKLHGVEVVAVDPRNTSRECSGCGCVDKRNRRSQAEFVCVSCGLRINADYNAALNIRKRALVNALEVSEQLRSCAA